MTDQTPPAPATLVEGQVRDDDHRPAAGVEVRLRRVGAKGRAATLGRATTDAEGRYAIAYDPDGPADVEVVVAGAPAIARFAAAARETVDVTLGDVPFTGLSLVERLADGVDAVLGAGHVLSDDDAERVAAHTGADPDDVRLLAAARRVGAEAAIPPAIAFALVAGGLPADAAELAAASPGTRRAALDAALEQGLVPRAARADADAALAGLRDRHVAQRLDVPLEGALAGLAEALEAGGVRTRKAQEAALTAIVDDDGASAPEDLGLEAGVTLALALAALTDANPKLIARVRKQRGVAALRDLAPLDAAAWRALIDDAGAPVPDAFTGGSAERRRDAYAEALADRLEAAYPSEAILGRAANDPELPDQKALARFVAAQPGFRLDGPAVAAQLDAGAAGAVEPAVVEKLSALQRLSRVTGRYAEIRAMIRDGMGSAVAIGLRGETAFAGAHAKVFGGEEPARLAHRRAADRSAAALSVLVTLAPPFQIGTLATPVPPPAPVPGIPDWEELFGSGDFCDCEHCGSVLGPAAYLTDVLHFLEQRPARGGRNAKQVLFARRPDLGELELSCNNTNITLPYLDLVNEVLEGAVAPRAFDLDVGLAAQDLPGGVITQDLSDAFTAAGFPLTAGAQLREDTPGSRWSIRDDGRRFAIVRGTAYRVTVALQTSGTAREREANPEHVHPAAYVPLAAEPYPWGLPYDTWLDEVRVFLEPLGVDRVTLMRDFGRPGDPEAVDMAAERLGLAPGETGLLTGAVPAWQAWGAGSAASWTVPLRNVRVLLDRSGLRFEELTELLALRWVNPGGVRRIASGDPADPNTCDTTKLVITGLSAADADRIHRFTRLRRRLGWTAHELDRALALLPGGVLDADALVVLAGFETLRRASGLAVDDLLSWFAPLDTFAYRDAGGGVVPSPYDRLFRNRSVVKRAPGQADPFALDAAGTELAVVGWLATDPTEPEPVQRSVRELRAAVAGALGIAQSDLVLLVDGPDAVVSGGREGDLANLSRVRRHVALARGLRLTVAETLALKRLVGIDPFVDAAGAVGVNDLARARFFTEAAEQVRAAGVPIAELDLLLAHRDDPRAPRAPGERILGDVLAALRATLQAIRDETLPVPDPTGEVLARKLVAAGLTEPDAAAARALLLGEAVAEAPLAALPAGVALPAALPVAHVGGTLRFTGPMTLADRAALEALSTDTGFTAAVAALFAAPRDQAAALFGALLDSAAVAALFDAPHSAQERVESALARVDAELRRTGGARAVEQLLAETLELQPAGVDVLLSHWAVDPADPAARLLPRFVDPAFVDSAGPVTAAAFPALHHGLALLYKTAGLARAHRLPAPQLELLLAQAGALGWLDPATLPLDPADPPASLQPWLRLDGLLRWQAQLSAEGPTPLELLVAAAAFDPAAPGTVKADLLAGWAHVTGWDPAALAALVGAPGDPADGGLLGLPLPAVAGDINPWADEATWLRVRRCFDAAARTGASVAACAAWARATVGEDDSRNARQALKARHDAGSWPRSSRRSRTRCASAAATRSSPGS